MTSSFNTGLYNEDKYPERHNIILLKKKIKLIREQVYESTLKNWNPLQDKANGLMKKCFRLIRSF